MDNLYNTEQIATHNQQSLTRLVRSIVLSQGQFSLILARCNYARLQLKLILQLQQASPIPVQKLILPDSVETLYTTLCSAIKNQPPSAFMILGLENVKALDQLLNSTNQVRDEFRKTFNFPLILWITDEVATKLIRLAPDFKSWAAATIKFDIATHELVEYLHQQASLLFSSAELKIKAGDFASQYSVPYSQASSQNYDGSTRSSASPGLEIRGTNDFVLGSQRRREIESAWRDVESRGHQLEPVLKACREFIWAQDNDTNDQSDIARIHYQKSFISLLYNDSSDAKTRSQFSNQELLENEVVLDLIEVSSGSKNQSIDSGYHYFSNQQSLIKYQGIVLFYIALTYRLQAARNPGSNQILLRKAQVSLDQCQQVFEQAQCPDLVAGVMSYMGELLQRLQKWDELQTFSQRLLKMHLTHGTPHQLAKDYGFMAEVALQYSQWSKAHKLARLALTILPTSEPVSSRTVYLLLLARSTKHLGEWDEAIEILEQAKAGAEPQYDPQLYIDILSELRSIYYEKCEYVTAFRIKKKQREIEHQYGFRAFIGAHSLQPNKQVINPSSVKLEMPMMAEEIMASCRRRDINDLLQRLGRDDHKLIVIHGRSGVGKSSLVNAGLVPALMNMSLSARRVLPVVIRRYIQWSKEVEQALTRSVLTQEKINIKHQSDLKKSWKKTISIAAYRSWEFKKEYPHHFLLDPNSFVLKNLRRNADSNQITVLIFDQFEEFFFVNSPAEVRAFSQFIRICLDLPFVKVVLSLREDYIHYLLEFESLVRLTAINDNILDKNIRYQLRDFSKAEAKAIIERLTQRAKFELEPTLINTLVKDLANEQEEVRPIELQVVGAQLQEEGEHGITTLAQYRKLGTNPKAELIKHSIEQVIKDCGQENEDAAWDILFALTDEKFTRPIKTRRELVAAIRSNPKLDSGKDSEQSASFIDVILESGLLLRQREKPNRHIASNQDNRYQLIHDYLVLPIRQSYAIKEQQHRTEIHQRLQQAQEAKKEVEAALQKMSQQQLIHRNRVLQQLLGLMVVTVIGLGFATQMAYKQKQLANIATLTAASDALYFSHQKFDAIIESLRAAKRLQKLKKISFNNDLQDTEIQIAATLQQVVYGIHELNRLEGHSEVIWDVSFSPNGKIIASGSVDKTIKLWTPEGKPINTFKGHRKSITSVSFHPNSQIIASSSQDKTVKVWNLGSNPELPTNPMTLKGHRDIVSRASFSADGQMIASSSEDKTVKLWDLEGQLLRTITTHKSSLNWVSFSPDNEVIATAGNDGTARLLTLTGERVLTLRHSSSDRSKVYMVTFSPDGQYIATVGSDQTVKLWTRQGRLLKILRGHHARVYGVEFSPDNQTLATASADKTIKLWSRREGKLLTTFQGHGDQVTNVSFSPDGQILASSSYDKKVKLWRIDDIPLKILEGHRDRVLGVSFSPDGQILASASQDKTVRLWSRSGISLQTLTGYDDRVSSVSFNPDGKLLATASYDKSVKLWQMTPPEKQDQQLESLWTHETLTRAPDVEPLDFSLLKSWNFEQSKIFLSPLAIGDASQQLTRFSTETLYELQAQYLARSSDLSIFYPFSLIKSWTAHRDSVISISFSPDGQFIVTGSKDNTVKLWTSEGRLLHSFSGHQGWVNSVSFSPDGQLIASSSDDGTVRLWNLQGKQLQEIRAHEAYVLGVSFSPDGRTIASAGYDNTVKLWSRQGVSIDTLLKGSSDSVTSVIFSPDGQLIASASYDGYVRLWSRHNGTLLKTLVGHRDSVMSISFSPDSKVLASASRDRNVILWNLDLDDLTQRACEWVGDYLKYNLHVKKNKEDRSLCQGIYR